MSSSKAKMLFNELERSRFTGSWSEVPEFARRYRKHEPKGIALQNLSLAEHTLYNLKPAYSNSHYINDSETNLSLPPTLQNGNLRQVREFLNLAKTEPKLNEKDWSMQISVCEAKVHCLEGNFQVIPELLLSYNLTHLKASIITGTELLTALWGLYLLGLSYEVDNNQFQEALQYYQCASEIMNRYRGEKSMEYSVIEENIIYRLGYIQLKLDHLEDGISTMKIYSSCCSRWGERFKPQKQINVLKKLTETFAKEPSLGSASTLQIPNIPDIIINSSIESVDELIETQSRYEASIYQMIEYPKAGSENFQLLDMSDLFISNWRKFNINSPKFTRQLLNSMYKVAKFTFQSPKVMRHIFNLLYSLSEFEECKLALDSYKNLIEKSIEVKDSCIFNPISASGTDQAIPTNMEPLEAVIETYLLGIKFLIDQFRDPKTALEYAEKSLVLSLPYKKMLPTLLSRVYQYMGICHGHLILSCQSKDERSYHHIASLEAFEKSIELNPNNWESCYFMALAHAQGREIESAVELVKKSLELQPSFAQSWHLLVLLMSAQRQFEQALELCEVGIQESSSKIPNLDTDAIAPETSIVDEEEIFNLKITQNIIKETLYGHREALSGQGQLFTLFTKIYGNIDQIPTETNSSAVLLKSPSPVPRLLPEDPNSSVRTTPKRKPSENQLTPNLARSISQPHIMSPESSSTLVKNPLYSLPKSTQSLPHLMHKRTRGIDTLVSLWLMSATMYCKLNKFKDAKLATEEAENCCPTSPDIWAKYGDIYLAQKQYDEALISYQRGLVLQPNHVPSQLGLGKVYLENNKLDLAEASLSSVTNSGSGWFLAEAWYLLGKIHRETKRFKLAKEYLLYSMDLLNSSPVRSFEVLWNLRCLT